MAVGRYDLEAPIRFSSDSVRGYDFTNESSSTKTISFPIVLRTQTMSTLVSRSLELLSL